MRHSLRQYRSFADDIADEDLSPDHPLEAAGLVYGPLIGVPLWAAIIGCMLWVFS